MSLDYAAQKFSVAVSSMATSPEPIQQRLVSAMLTLTPVTERDLPEYLREEFRHLHNRMTAGEPAGNEGTIEATVRQMDDNTAVTIAKDLVELAAKVDQALRAHE